MAASSESATWTQLKGRHGELTGWQNAEARGQVEARMKSLAGGLARDPQVESILAGRKPELGLKPGGSTGRDLGEQLTRAITRGLSIGFGR